MHLEVEGSNTCCGGNFDAAQLVFYGDVNVQRTISALWSMWLFKSPLEGAEAYCGGPTQAAELVSL